MSKTSIRKEMSRMRREMSLDAVVRKSHMIADRLFALEMFQESGDILTYLSLPQEVQTDSIIERALALGKNIYVPLVDRNEKRLLVTRLRGLDIGFVEGDYGVRVPAEKHWDIVPPSTVDLVVCPGLAFDERGGRLGFGGGYFDRLFRELPDRVFRLALAFQFQILKRVPVEEGDEFVQKIITEEVTIHC